MSKLRERLKERAEIVLDDIVNDAFSALEGLHPQVGASDIAALAFNTRSASLKKKVIGRMVAAMEDELVEKLNNQQDLPLQNDKVRPEDEEKL